MAPLSDETYAFAVPPQTEAGNLHISVGDARRQIGIVPIPRPELTGMIARVRLPEYLQRSSEMTRDVRGGSISLVTGSEAILEAMVSRPLEHATFDGKDQDVRGDTIVTNPIPVETPQQHTIGWKDEHGLTAKEPFVVNVRPQDDGEPTLLCNKLNDGQVLLEEEVLSFELQVEDDFGVRHIGMEWQGIEDPLYNPNPDSGEKVIAAGGPEAEQVEAVATFSAKRESVKPQTIAIRLYATDYLPGRPRVYSPVYVVHVLTEEDHAVWLTQQFRRWFQQSQEVYEREQQLYATNRELRDLPPKELDRPQNRRKIESQATAEMANGRRLNALTRAGDTLVKQAVRNDQFNVETLENWAQSVQTLKEIADARMPSVADLLKQAAAAPASLAGESSPKQSQPKSGGPNSGQPKASGPQVGENRDTNNGGKPTTDPADQNKPSDETADQDGGKSPSMSDVESSFNEPGEPKDNKPKPSGAGKFWLAIVNSQRGRRSTKIAGIDGATSLRKDG